MILLLTLQILQPKLVAVLLFFFDEFHEFLFHQLLLAFGERLDGTVVEVAMDRIQLLTVVDFSSLRRQLGEQTVAKQVMFSFEQTSHHLDSKLADVSLFFEGETVLVLKNLLVGGHFLHDLYALC